MSSAKREAVKPAKTGEAGDLAAARRVLSLASAALGSLSSALNGDFSRAVEAILAVRGRVIVSGMGKSGHIARKVAATLSSTGTPAYFVHPTEASHGDLGVITPDDLLLLFSWGGGTAELGDLITYAKRFSIPIIAVAGNPASTLVQAGDIALLLPRADEACPMGLAPTTSTTMMLALGDAIAVALMERRSFSPDQYRAFHPGGSLGRALIRVGDLMHVGEDVPLAAAETSMRDVLLVMTQKRFGCVGILDQDGALIGIITDGDLARHMNSAHLLDSKARDVMTQQPKIAAPGQLAVEALAFMNANKITRLFVLDPADAPRRPLGILHIHDCLRAGLG